MHSLWLPVPLVSATFGLSAVVSRDPSYRRLQEEGNIALFAPWVNATCASWVTNTTGVRISHFLTSAMEANLLNRLGRGNATGAKRLAEAFDKHTWKSSLYKAGSSRLLRHHVEVVQLQPIFLTFLKTRKQSPTWQYPRM
jgi:hypothetical protein